MAFVAIFADVITVYDPVKNHFADMQLPPGAEHWLGTDQFGRDLLTRIIYGARTALFVGTVSAFIGSTFGLVLGVRSEEHTSELQSLMRISYAVFCLKKKKT